MSPQPCGTQIARLGFIKSLPLYEREKPYRVYILPSGNAENVKRTNVETEEVDGIEVHDIRGRRNEFRLDEHGFQAITHSMRFTGFHDEHKVETEYLPEVAEVIKRHIPDAKRVHMFDWRIRSEPVGNQENTPISPVDIFKNSYVLSPSKSAHNDITEATAIKRVRKHMLGEADELLKLRLRVVNFWRPLKHDVQNWPLVVCDGRTSPLHSLIASDQVSRRFTGDIYIAKYDPGYRWYYESNQTKDEGFLFKSWDSKEDVPSRYCIHTSMDIQPAENYHPRESIEARALVLS